MTKKLIDFATEKVNKLTHLFDGLISCDIILRLDKASTNENKVAEIKFQAKGQELFSKKQSTIDPFRIECCLLFRIKGKCGLIPFQYLPIHASNPFTFRYFNYGIK